MTKLDPIIAVKDVAATANWYEKIFGFRRAHGSNDFAVLENENGDVMLCLHRWAAHAHPSLSDQQIVAGNGLLLYFRTNRLNQVRKNVETHQIKVEEEIHLNENSLQREFSIRDPNGYFLTVSEYHEY